MVTSKWNIAVHDKEKIAQIARESKISELTAKLLVNRGYETKERINMFLEKSGDLFHDPFLMSDMEKGVDRVKDAVDGNEKIMIYGDYDVDGISSTCIMFMYLKKLRLDVCYYIPDRFEEGYGINKEAVKKAKEKNIDLIITVDTGITAVEETVYAAELGIDIIITDHHECPKTLPQAAAVINPKKAGDIYPFKELAGVGVAFKFITAYNTKYENEKNEAELKSYFEFVAMGTIADIMVLTNENRPTVDLGLKSMTNSKNFGINAVLESYFRYKNKRSVSTDMISFYISPRINAAGRLAKANRAVELFLSENKKNAEILAEELSVYNRQRQETEKEIFILAEREFNRIKDKDKKKIIVLHDDNWNQGVIGIVASKLSERYNKAFILFAKDAGGIYKGSCRSVKNINITEMLASCPDILIKYGGHERAAGLSAEGENIAELDRRLNEYANQNNIEIVKDKSCEIECEIECETISLEAVKEFERLEPFGNGNPVPLFAVLNCKILNVTPIGENKHIRIELARGRHLFEAVYFGMETETFPFEKNEYVDIACNINVNEFMNKERIQYIVRDIRSSENYLKHYSAEKENYYRFIRNDSGYKFTKNDVPDKEDFKSVYIFLLSVFKKDVLYDSPRDFNKLQGKYFENSETAVSRFKFRVIMDIFAEMKIIYLEHDFDSIAKIKINKTNDKTDLNDSSIYNKLKSLNF
ncbi:MAG: single-stranded-DNA-specific exonuclease RecJ [Oscillospiraceae bacterium]|nr:single-stranded-DNA-specific exonuclease RecJ [Oscillospiraceae bacterium]